MNPLLLELLPYIRQGYCCSQLLMLLLLQQTGQQYPALLRAMHGLCFGMGGSEGTCGLLTGGAAVLGCVAGRGANDESAHPMLVPLLTDYHAWFTTRTQPFGGCRCCHITQGLQSKTNTPVEHPEQPDPTVCGDLLAECWESICSLLESYAIPMEMP